MSSADRKRKILDHLNKSVEQSEFLTPKSAKPSSLESSSFEADEVKTSPEPPPPVVQSPRSTDRKRRVMTHVNQSSGDFGDFSLSSDTDKRKKIDHIRKSLG